MSFPTPSPVAGHRGHGHDSYRCLRLKSHIRRITGDGADLVIDPVGGPYAEPALRACRWGGRFVCVGFAAGEIPRIPLNLVLLKGITVRGFELRTLAGHLPERVADGEAALARLVAGGHAPARVRRSPPRRRGRSTGACGRPPGLGQDRDLDGSQRGAGCGRWSRRSSSSVRQASKPRAWDSIRMYVMPAVSYHGMLSASARR
ncbi:MAG: 2-haloacrylate reductase [Streptosporangiaceae bacterium]|nr:2-haloacrylate reductase [Streptosporangiaceae bacterium]